MLTISRLTQSAFQRLAFRESFRFCHVLQTTDSDCTSDDIHNLGTSQLQQSQTKPQTESNLLLSPADYHILVEAGFSPRQISRIGNNKYWIKNNTKDPNSSEPVQKLTSAEDIKSGLERLHSLGMGEEARTLMSQHPGILQLSAAVLEARLNNLVTLVSKKELTRYLTQSEEHGALLLHEGTFIQGVYDLVVVQMRLSPVLLVRKHGFCWHRTILWERPLRELHLRYEFLQRSGRMKSLIGQPRFSALPSMEVNKVHKDFLRRFSGMKDDEFVKRLARLRLREWRCFRVLLLSTQEWHF